MAFTDYKCIDAVVKKHRLRLVQDTVVVPSPDAPPFSDYFVTELQFNLKHLSLGRSEIGAGEIVLFPILREVWKPYAVELSLFTHEPLEYDDDLTGRPDYFISRVSEYGRTIPETPYLLIVEAKLDDFEKAWGQCLAAMLAAQKLNGLPELPVYGITTNSKAWEFGTLVGVEFTHQQQPYSLSSLDELRCALHGVMRACRDLARSEASIPLGTVN